MLFDLQTARTDHPETVSITHVEAPDATTALIDPSEEDGITPVAVSECPGDENCLVGAP